MTPFKNYLSPELVGLIADHLQKHFPDVDRDAFVAAISEQLPRLELKDRARLISHHLNRVLPADLGHRYEILRAMLHPVTDAGIDLKSDELGIRGWGIFPLAMVVGQCGLSDFDLSFDLLKEMTKRHTAEFDVRPFLQADQDKALAIMADWLDDENEHVRRLVSEGTRPRLPWGAQLPKLIADPSPTLPLLEKLRDDKSEYVRRSVANHLNDIAKDHPDLVAQLSVDWMKDASPNRQKLVRHACRTLIKDGNATALSAFGLLPPNLELDDLSLSRSDVKMGEAIEFKVSISTHAKSAQALILDYVIHFRKANGSLSPKVFKWTKLTLAPGGMISFTRNHMFREITTRKYHMGQHAVSLRINGKDFGYEPFTLRNDENQL